MSILPTTVLQDNTTISVNNYPLENPVLQLILNSTSLLVCFFGLVGNGIVAFFLGFRMKRNTFTVYILNLTVADFMFLLCAVFIVIHVMVFTVSSHTLSKHLDLDRILTFVLCIIAVSLFGYNTSLFLLTAISLERCLSVLFPIWHQCQRPKHQSAAICGLLWVLSFLVTVLEFFACDKRNYLYGYERFTTNNSRWCYIAYISISLLNFLVFTPLMVFASLTLIIKVKKDSKKQQPCRLYRVIVATVVLFLIFAMPIRVMLLVEYRLQAFPPMIVVDVSSFLCAINSSINPFVYWFVGRLGGGEGSFHAILQRVFRDDMKEHRQHHERGCAGSKSKETVV